MIGARKGRMVRPEREAASPVTGGPCPPGGPDPYDGAGDVCLVVGVIRRDRKALREIYCRYGGELHGLALRLCGEGPAEEVLEEVFLELWRTPEQFDFTRGPLLTNLKRQVYGAAGDRLRSDRTRRAGESSLARRSATPSGDVEGEAFTRTSDGAWGLLDALPTTERESIVLATFEGHTSRDVADLLGHAERSINSGIRSGLTTLRLQLSQAGAVLPSP